MLHEEPDGPPDGESAPGGDTPSGEALFRANLDVIERVLRFVCRRQRMTAADGEDFASHARLKLMEDGYAVLSKFRGTNLGGFLNISIQRMFFDYRTAAWGKWRPCAAATKRGPVAMLLDQLTTRDGHSFEEALEIITTNHRLAVPRTELEQIAALLPRRQQRRFDGDDALANTASNESADDGIVEAERLAAAARAHAALREELSRLPAQDRLLIQLRDVDGRSVRDIAAMLQLEPKPLYGRIQRLRQDLKNRLERRGIEPGGLFD